MTITPGSMLTVRIDPDLHEQLRSAAYWTRETKRAIVETALRAHLEQLRTGGDLEPLPDGTQLSRGRRPGARTIDSMESPDTESITDG